MAARESLQHGKLAIIIIPHHENTVAYGINSWMYQVHSSKLQTCFFYVACNYFMLKANVIMLLTIEPIVQSRQLQ